MEHPENAAESTFRFQVNLGGMLDILSNHLYKSPDVFLRELLQNGIDAITLRKKRQPEWCGGRITIALTPGEKLVLRDNGAGLTQEEVHRFLAVIGQSSKTILESDGTIPEDYIGRFGIGLLSCFMVSDSIVVETQPAGGGTAHVWTGYPDGTYTLEPLEVGVVGTAVTLTAKKGAERYFFRREIERLVLYYGLALPVPVCFAGETDAINRVPGDFSSANRGKLLAFEEFLDVLPIATPHLSGAAFVLPYRTDPSSREGHRIYLKQMLLTEHGDTLLPPWAFFLRCFLNTQGLRPTASREDFYEDQQLDAARQEFAGAVRDYLETLSQEEPERLRQLVDIHAQAIKSMAVWDDSLFRIFIDFLPFETSQGTLTGRALKRAGEGCWVSSVPRFQQLKPVFLAQGRLLICTGYVYDQELVAKLASFCSLPLSPLGDEGMELVLEEPTRAEKEEGFSFLRAANRVLAPLDFSDALGSLLSGQGGAPLSTLYLNLNNPLVRRLYCLPEGELLEDALRILYVQALLAGGHPLRGGELKLMNQSLLGLVEEAAGRGKTP